MNEPLDIEFKNRVAEVFDNYDDGHGNEGWALLRQKFPEKKKDKGIIWWYSAAAVLLVLITFFWLLKPVNELVAVKPSVKHSRLGETAHAMHTDTVKALERGNFVTASSTDNNTIKQKGLFSNKGIGSDKYKHPFYARRVLAFEQPMANAQAIESKIKEASLAMLKPISALKLKDSIAGLALAQQPAVTIFDHITGVVNSKKPALEDRHTDPVLKMMADDKAREKVATASKTSKESIVAFSPYAATYFNYAKGSSAQINVGAGVSTDFKLSSNIKLSTGLAVAQNSLNYNNGFIPAGLASSALADANLASPVYNSGASTSSSTNTSAVNNYKANLIGLDIPLNFKYQFNPLKSDTYISAGISSGTFINETYSSTVQFNNQATSAFNSTQTTSNSTHFGTFNFARTLNLSFGVGYPVGSNRLIIEPFLKYPLGGVGAQNIQFGASGVNFKLNIGNSKK